MSVKGIFESMSYGPALESATEAQAWLAGHDGGFGHFIGGAFTRGRADFLTRNPANGAELAGISQGSAEEVGAAIAAARRAQKGWAALGGAGRARYLYALARLVQKHARMLAVLETLDSGKPIREARDIDIPLAARHFYYHAGMAQLMGETMADRAALGVAGQIVPWNFPLLMLAWKIAPALAMGNTVVLKPAEWTPLTALYFAEICVQAGLPAGVVNIVTGDGDTGAALVSAEGVDKIAFTGSTAVGREIRCATAGRGIALTLELGGKSPYIVFDDADLDSAIEGLVDAIWFNGGQVCCAGSRLLVQESIAEVFLERLRERMGRLRVGDPLDKCIDIGALVDPAQKQRIEAMLAAHPEGAVFRPQGALPEGGAFMAPTLISGLSAADPLMQEEIFGPVLVSTTFRTPSEAVALANDSRYGLAASVWSENISLALDIAPRLAVGVVWVNGANMFDAAAGFGGIRESGFGREGGWEGLRAYSRPAQAARSLTSQPPHHGKSGAASGLDRTAKLYIAGKQARPDGGYVREVFGKSGKPVGLVPEANRKDVRNAVEAARGAGGWAGASAHLRAQVLYYIAENLAARSDEFAARLDAMQGGRGGATEVAAAVDRLFTYAAWADKYDGAVRAVPMRGTALAMHEPVGVIGALCPDEAPLLGLVSVMAPALAMGNRVVLVASHPYPLAATDFYQVLDTSDVPGGAVNILTGDPGILAPVLAAHMDVDAVWNFAGAELCGVIEEASAGNLKRSWVNNGQARDWSKPDAAAFLAAATEVKTVWIPYGA